MTFELANRYSRSHLIVQPSDLELGPPESYLFIQDGLIICKFHTDEYAKVVEADWNIACGVLYALCYLFYMTRTFKDKTVAGGIEYLYEKCSPIEKRVMLRID